MAERRGEGRCVALLGGAGLPEEEEEKKKKKKKKKKKRPSSRTRMT